MERHRKEVLQRFQCLIGVRFKNIGLLDRALTHRTFAVESKKTLQDNERLEFLGDAVLNLAISTYLYRRYPGYSEGELSMARSRLVNEKMLARKARLLNLGNYLRLGKGEELTGGRNKDSILSSALEAVIGGIYLEYGFERVYRFIKAQFREGIERTTRKSVLKEPKGRLQEIVERKSGRKPFYRISIIKDAPYGHIYKAEVWAGRKFLGTGRGRTRKDAEKNAALNALKGGIDGLSLD